MTEADSGRLDAALEDVCMDRLAVADDIAPVVAFLASTTRPACKGVDRLNGGLLAHLPGAVGSPA